MSTATQLDSPERLTSTVVPPSKEVSDYERGRKAGKEEAKNGEKKGFISSLIDDLNALIERSDEEKKKKLTALTKEPTVETVVSAFSAAHDVTAEASAAYAMRSTNEAKAIEMQTAAANKFLSQDPLVREGAMLILYMRAEAEYAQNQRTAGYVDAPAA